MGLNKNIVLVMVALAMTLAMWIMPEHISAQTQQKRLLQLTDYATNPNRLSGVGKFCEGVSRDDLINEQDKATAQSYKDALASQFNIEANSFINDALNGNIGDQVASITTPLAMFVGAFAVGFALILILWSCLCCCCCCPSCCPSKCCQKDQNEQYTKCELYWPSITLIALLLMIIIVSAMGMSNAGFFEKGLGDIQCSLSMMLDNIVNGNVTTSGSYFIGVVPLISQIALLDSNVGSLTTQMNSLNNTITTIGSDFTNMALNVKKTPNNDVAGTAAVINYQGNIGDTTPTAGAIQSKFVDVLGKFDEPSSIVGILYTSLTSTSDTLESIRAGADGFSGGISGFQSQITTINSDLANVRNQINDLDSSLSSSLELLDTPKSMGTLVINVIYGVMLGLSILAMLGVVLMTFCDKYKCRYLMYFSCVILFFLAILGFIIAMLFSIIIPVMYFMCGWLDVTLTETGFLSNTQSLLTDADVRTIVGTCLEGGDGQILNAIGGATVNDPINGLRDAIKQTKQFNTTTYSATITQNLDQITDTLVDFQFGRLIDIDDANAIGTLNSLTNPGSSCSQLADDGYVPSTNGATTTYPLPFSPPSMSCNAGNVVNSTTCTKANFESNSPPASCKGCIDTSDIFLRYYTTANPNGTATLSNAAAWKSILDTRYGSSNACIQTFTTTFGNVWQNYYKIKINSYSPILARWKSVSDSSDTTSDISNVNDAFNDINSTMTSVIGALTGGIERVTDPKYGMIAGLNCHIIGEDLKLVIASICVSNFNTIYITRLLLGIASFGILFSMCCIVCSGVRHFKHSERKDRVSPNFMGDKNSFENTDAAFRP